MTAGPASQQIVNVGAGHPHLRDDDMNRIVLSLILLISATDTTRADSAQSLVAEGAKVKSLAMPNGIVFSPDATRIYIADTGGHQRHPDPKFHTLPASIQCHEISPAGTLGRKLFQIDSGSDGMAVDVQGNLYTTHSGKVHVTTPTATNGSRSMCPRARPMSALAARTSRRCSSRHARRFTACG